MQERQLLVTIAVTIASEERIPTPELGSICANLQIRLDGERQEQGVRIKEYQTIGWDLNKIDIS